MTLSRRKLVALLGSAAGPGGLAACGGATASPGGDAAKKKEPLTLTLNGTDSEMGEMAAARFPAFEQKYGYIKINYDNPPDYSTKLTVLAAAGSLGDVAMSYTNTGQYHFLA